MNVSRKENASPRRPRSRHSEDTTRRSRPAREFRGVLERRRNGAIGPAPDSVSPKRSHVAASTDAPVPRRDAQTRPTHRHADVWTFDELPGEPGVDEETVAVRPVDLVGELAPRQQAAAVEAAKPPVRQELDPVFDRVVQQVVVVEDRHRRRAVRMRLSVRGTSDLDVEVVPGSHGTEVRFSTDDEELRRELRRRRSELTGRARERGVELASVRVT